MEVPGATINAGALQESGKRSARSSKFIGSFHNLRGTTGLNMQRRRVATVSRAGARDGLICVCACGLLKHKQACESAKHDRLQAEKF
eukprot:3664847-Pleurochrysis_carterae.AAC.1